MHKPVPTGSEALPAPSTSHRIPSLDGLRAVSIAFVMIGHGSATFPHSFHSRPFNLLLSAFGRGELGVNIFFCISGFLITGLLVKEAARHGSIDLLQFYLRRSFRILPAFYTYLAAIAVLSSVGIAYTSAGDLAKAGCFIWNYTGGQSWFVGHVWSLSVEEQFYLLWPMLLAFLGERKSLVMAVAIIAISPFLRLAQYAAFPAWRGYIPIMLHTRADMLMTGCVCALTFGNSRSQRIFDALDRCRMEWLSVGIVLVLIPVMEWRFRGAFTLTAGYSLEALSIAVMMMWAIRHHDRGLARFLNLKFVESLGVISYSLYLWQQLFLTNQNHTIYAAFPLNMGMALLAASMSYHLIEKPMLRLRDRVLRPRIVKNADMAST